MKSITIILVLGVTVGAFVGGFLYGKVKPAPPVPQQLTLEEILSIRQLHLVKHAYTDLIFLHKGNDRGKAIRAIAEIPVEVSAYLDLRKVQLVKQGDSLRQIILPRAILQAPSFKVERMVIRETRSFMIHVGKDLYTGIGEQLQVTLATRSDSICNTAIANRILVQAEEEGKTFVLQLLKDLGHQQVTVVFEPEVAEKSSVVRANGIKPPRQQLKNVEVIAFGYIPFW